MNILLKELKPEYNIIDIRDREDYEKGHVINSKNIPMNDLLNNHEKYLNKNKTYYIYCTSGIRSKKTCLILRKLGYTVVNVMDGFGK